MKDAARLDKDRWVLVPWDLDAAGPGAEKGHMIGEFYETIESGRRVEVTWTTIKEIRRSLLEFHSSPGVDLAPEVDLYQQVADARGLTREEAKKSILRQAFGDEHDLADQVVDLGTFKVIQEVLKERERQVTEEGWSHERDDKHDGHEIAMAAGSYAFYAGSRSSWPVDSYQKGSPPRTKDGDSMWPWSWQWWKPKSPRRDLVRAAALIVAEIERLDRKEAARG